MIYLLFPKLYEKSSKTMILRKRRIVIKKDHFLITLATLWDLLFDILHFQYFRRLLGLNYDGNIFLRSLLHFQFLIRHNGLFSLDLWNLLIEKSAILFISFENYLCSGSFNVEQFSNFCNRQFLFHTHFN
jgi:hypothetical protein